jgi:hypothetical protein
MNLKQSNNSELNEQLQILKNEYLARKTFHLIKTGKEPKRKNLFKNLFYLAGFGDKYLLIMSTGQKSIDSNLYQFCKIKIKETLDESVADFMVTSIIDICNKYLNLVSFNFNKSYIWTLDIAYSDVQWENIDLELLSNHSDNIDIINYFPSVINFKKIPQNIKNILEEKKLEFENKKELEKQQLMIDYLSSKGYSIQKPNYE